MNHAILVPIDGSTHAEKALAVAAQMAMASSAAIHLLHVTEYPDDIGILMGASKGPLTEERREKLAAENREKSRRVLDQARQAVDLSGLEVKELIREGRPARAILQEAKEVGADVIVMGSRGMSDLKGMVVGSVSHRVSHGADCTVITVT
ncbi:universal stress protein [Halomonas campisalis]|uniref:Universal stress protein n=1 Tax=Billgrantia campisalis TaxID=74661 RepID=A0ABS9PCG6_9GAMM|nr:universal stress protein [Halomonas campisalis]MCG6659468.1 universal stress protein [Halomonas campisalis]MDR5864329.1 universal stress protein [Halomonas campisalis]